MEFTTAKVIIIMQTTKQNGGKSDVFACFFLAVQENLVIFAAINTDRAWMEMKCWTELGR